MLVLTTLLAVCVLGVSARPNEKSCLMTPWSDWGECLRNPPCSDPSQEQPRSFPVPATTRGDEGRARMMEIMKEKTRANQRRAECLADNTCPELAYKKSEGPAPCVGGVAAGQYNCRNADLLHFLSISDLGYNPSPNFDSAPNANDVWGWTDPETGDEYVMQGLSGGTSFVRITPDPTNPVVLGFMHTRSLDARMWRDIKVIGNYAFIVSECTDHGLQVYDLTQLRGIESFSILEPTAEYSMFGNAHNIAANVETGFVYVIGATDPSYAEGCRGGLHAINVRDPLNPVFAGCFDFDGYVHDTQCVIYHGPDVDYQGREICFCFNEDSLTIVDVHDKLNMRLISKRGYDGYGYTHQGWLTEDQTIVLLDDEADEFYTQDNRTRTYMWDVRTLGNPVLQYTHISSVKSCDHNQYVLGDYVYQSNYEAGLRILHINQADFRLQEVAYFDNYPPGTEKGFHGSWSNYPYFKSGVVPVSSIEFGLYLVRPNYAAFEGEVAKDKAYAEETRTRGIVSATDGSSCLGQEQSRPCRVEEC